MLVTRTKVENAFWNNVSEDMKSDGIILSAKVLEAKYKWLLKNDRIDANGLYIAPEGGPIAEATPPATPAAETTKIAGMAEAVEGAVQADVAVEADVEAEIENGDKLDLGAEDETLDA